jgi:hypothetical protein
MPGHPHEPSADASDVRGDGEDRRTAAVGTHGAHPGKVVASPRPSTGISSKSTGIRDGPPEQVRVHDTTTRKRSARRPRRQTQVVADDTVSHALRLQGDLRFDKIESHEQSYSARRVAQDTAQKIQARIRR